MDVRSISEQSLKEYRAIREIMAEKFVDIEQIKGVNQKIRELLSVASNTTVMMLIPGSRLSLLEINRRIQGETFNNLDELFYLKEQLYMFYSGRVFNKIYFQVNKRILDLSKKSSTLEIAEVLRNFGVGIIGDDLTICEEICELRTDLEQVLELINSFELNSIDLDKINWIINRGKEMNGHY